MKPMQPYNFTNCPDRRHSGSEKWDRYTGTDILPMWVADMDFQSAPEIIQALHERIDHGVFGYTHATAEQNNAICDAMRFYFDWRIESDWLVWVPNLVTGLSYASRGLCDPGEAVVTMPPIYPPFLHAPASGERQRVDAPLQLTKDGWRLDENALAALPESAKLLLWCHPHNPVGRAWSESELHQVADLARERNWVVCSDEIHCNLVHDNRRHIPFASLSADAASRTVTLMAASKTWNLPGIACGFAIISDPNLRRRFVRAGRGFPKEQHALSYIATAAAYSQGEPWRLQLMQQLAANRAAVTAAVAGWPGFSMTPVEATYLAWIDCRDSGLANPAEAFEAGGVGVAPGDWYGMPGFIRLNFGCPAAMLATALARMTAVIDAR